MKKLSVIYDGWGERFALGTLGDDGTHLLFEYTPDALRRGLELSPLRLPLRQAAYGDFPQHQLRLPGLIADALPDGWGMLLMDRLFRKQGREPRARSPLDRLAFIGSHAMGALTFEPAEGTSLDAADVSLLDLAKNVRKVIKSDSVSLLRELALLGGSPHGARPKVLLNYDAATGQLSNSEQDAGTPWLIKFPAQQEAKEVCAVEALYATLAQACGIPIPKTHLFDLGKSFSAFGIERFDREDEARVPMLSAAAALDMDFRMPSIGYNDLLRLTRFITRDEREVQRVFERCVFNVLFNNRDDHAKNFSFLLARDGRWRSSPAYDLTFNAGPGGEHQTDIAGEGRLPGREHLLALATQGGVASTFAHATVERMLSVSVSFRQHASHFAISRATVKFMADTIDANRKRLHS